MPYMLICCMWVCFASCIWIISIPRHVSDEKANHPVWFDVSRPLSHSFSFSFLSFISILFHLLRFVIFSSRFFDSLLFFSFSFFHSLFHGRVDLFLPGLSCSCHSCPVESNRLISHLLLSLFFLLSLFSLFSAIFYFSCFVCFLFIYRIESAFRCRFESFSFMIVFIVFCSWFCFDFLFILVLLCSTFLLCLLFSLDTSYAVSYFLYCFICCLSFF